MAMNHKIPSPNEKIHYKTFQKQNLDRLLVLFGKNRKNVLNFFN
ncbi:MAG: hypothetical protein TRG1_1575 [Flavobacteriaceae bacterium FS1-H7996/R]|nr:MAG: hypothetical protein TRG1_1575 [Flavobacteriaceae bacterium FS1-H7996/R]